MYFKQYIKISHGDIAQLARAPALQAGGQGFDSLYLHHQKNIKFKFLYFSNQHIEKYIEKSKIQGKLEYSLSKDNNIITIEPKTNKEAMLNIEDLLTMNNCEV